MQSKNRIAKLKEATQLLSGKKIRQPKCWIVITDVNGNIESSTPEGYPEEYTEEDTAFIIRSIKHNDPEMIAHRKRCGLIE